jgi:sulfite reductase (NADPH) flavoprotein alpha-component
MSISIDRKHPFSATLKERVRLTAAGSTKATYHVVLDLAQAPLSFLCGDSVGVYAQNDPLLVDRLLDALKASGEELIIDKRSGASFPLRTFLASKANLSRLTSAFLHVLQQWEPLHDQKNRLRHLLLPESKPLLADYLLRHDPLDALREYAHVQPPLQELCDQFAPLLPRFYSAASSPKMHPDEVHLTVALLTHMHGAEQRFGVASHFLCHLAEAGATPIPIYIQPAHGFVLPEDPDTPIIMIGPGTGVAPFRAFMQERLVTGSRGRNWLFFGERHRATDYLYETFWAELASTGRLRLDLAFSRDQPDKVYVQHRLYEQRADLWKWLQEGAVLYVCGDAARMAKEVEATLLRLFREAGGHSDEGAKAYLKSLRAQKRYLQDVY